MEHIAFLGLGKMGTGMAGNLLRAGYPLTVYNRTRVKALALRDQGAIVADTPAAAVKNADVVISMVADNAASRAVWTGDVANGHGRKENTGLGSAGGTTIGEGALGAIRSGALAVECSTLSVEWVRELGTQLKDRGVDLVDAPVRGGPDNAHKAQITFLAAGEPNAFARARPILEKLSRGIDYLGVPGHAALMKLINNMMIAVEVELFHEALLLAERAGLDVAQAAQLLSEGGPGSRVIQHRVADILSKNFAPRFELRLMHKDMSYALDEAVRCGIPLPTVAASCEVYRLAMTRGLGGIDWGGVGEALR